MKFRHNSWLAGFLGLCAVIPFGTLWAQTASEKPAELADKYTIIFERNIFSRDRQPHQTLEEMAPPPTPPAPPIEASYVLRGISKELTKTIAFVEQVDQGKIEKYQVGSPIAQGRIASLTLDSLTYEMHPEPNDPNTVELTEVKVGQTLLGQARGNDTRFRGNSGGTRDRFRRSQNNGDNGSRDRERSSESTDTPPSLDGADPSEILRQLMERRQRELDN
jgi:hypothetical protein